MSAVSNEQLSVAVEEFTRRAIFPARICMSNNKFLSSKINLQDTARSKQINLRTQL